MGMQLTPQLVNLSRDTIASQSGIAARCEAANFRWEPAISDERAAEYSAYVEGVATHKDWKAEHKGYVSSFVQVAKDLPRSAECFMAVNAQAHLNEQLDNTYLLRLESFDYLFSHPLVANLAEAFWQRFFKSQKDLRKANLNDTDEALRSDFINQWNAQRIQARPLFSAFLNDFGGNLDALCKEDWPHLLRDRLGLTHWPSTAGKPLPVALMCYTVDEVRQARLLARKKGAVASLSRPTVLDAEMYAAFIPAPFTPGGASYGHTLDLTDPVPSVIPTDFTPELLNFPLDYLPRHIKALGFITRAHALQDDAATLTARNRHVQGLQTLPGCAGFGEVLV
ncbi:hypothetical protein KIH07_21630 [Hydrogenophaga taeniospiralis]|uniref:hypothetical protein n=1 Tax=Hydrogenophaga taeniospiralis TaxID=65656 RepID=UPI001CFC134A|nr:hypothetical protein [Hydrogenophaga taeniospiralis]MCB4366345.1 hypothetical protein [Hydrogenophaga taeniospiralis]